MVRPMTIPAPHVDPHGDDRCSTCFCISKQLIIIHHGNHRRRLLVEGQFCPACIKAGAEEPFLAIRLDGVSSPPSVQDAYQWSPHMQDVGKARLMYELAAGTPATVAKVEETLRQLGALTGLCEPE